MLVLKSDFLLAILVAPLQGLESIGFRKTVDVGKFGGRRVDSVINLLVIFTNLSQDLLFLFLVSAVYDTFLVLEAVESLMEAQYFIC